MRAKRLFCGDCGDAREALYSMRNKRADLGVIARYCKNTAQYWHACSTLRAHFTRVSIKFPLARSLIYASTNSLSSIAIFAFAFLTDKSAGVLPGNSN